jgi:adhesin transport system membrane fusion protein
MMLVLSMVAVSIVAALVWMGFAEVDVVVRGAGKVIPSQKLQVVQSLEGGVISEIQVHEGDLVGVSQPLIKISDVAFASSFGENRLHLLELRANIARLKAEAHDRPFELDEEVAQADPDLMRSAEGLYLSRRREMEQTQQILEEQVRQHESELSEAQAKRNRLQERLGLMREELELKEPLVTRGLVSRVEFLQLKKQENEIRGDLESVRLSIPRIDSMIEEAKRKIEQSRLDAWNSATRPSASSTRP